MLVPRLKAAVIFSSVTPNPGFLLCPDRGTNPQEKQTLAFEGSQVHPDRTPLVGRQPLIGR